MPEPLRILLIDDSEIDAQMIERHLAKAGMSADFERAWELRAVKDFLEGESWSLILCDHFLPSFQSSDVLELIRELKVDDIPFILVSGLVDIGTAVSSMRNGANDFIFKDDLSRLVPAIEQALEKAEMKREKRVAEEMLRTSNEKLTFAMKSLANTQSQLVAVERFRALGEMSSGIAHDFNNSLTKMLGTLDLLERKAGGSDSLIDQLKKQIDDAASVVRRLCDFYRVNPATEEEAVDVAAVLEEAKQFTNPRWGKKAGVDAPAISLRVETEPNLYGWANASSLREVLTNLIFNSCDAMETTGGTITLVSRALDESVEIEVRDTGCGMTPEVLKRCLEPLYSTKGTKGTGMGLSIVNGVVQSFGGTLFVESEEGRGTSVCIRLKPALAESKATADRDSSTSREGRTDLRVLVVDDEPMIGSLLERQLQILGYEASSVTDPVVAAEMIAESFFHLIISDRSMPQMSGDELARRVSKESPKTKFAMASGYGDLMIANGELPEGVDIILPKPVSAETLREAIETLFPASVNSVALAG